MSHPFEYRKPTQEESLEMAAVSNLMRAVYDEIVSNVKPSAERTLAIRNLQQARMWVNVAILGIEIQSR